MSRRPLPAALCLLMPDAIPRGDKTAPSVTRISLRAIFSLRSLERLEFLPILAPREVEMNESPDPRSSMYDFIAYYLRFLRCQHGWSGGALADLLNCARSSVSRLVRRKGRRWSDHPAYGTAAEIIRTKRAEALGTAGPAGPRVARRRTGRAVSATGKARGGLTDAHRQPSRAAHDRRGASWIAWCLLVHEGGRNGSCIYGSGRGWKTGPRSIRGGNLPGQVRRHRRQSTT